MCREAKLYVQLDNIIQVLILEFLMNRIALIGNFPPRKCGIATFMNDLNDGIRGNGMTTSIVAMNDGVKKYNYPADVVFEIEQNEIPSYIHAATFLNTHHFDAVILQHEFGIFGGPDGRYIIQLLKRLRIPVITTMHTILDTPSQGQRMAVNEIARLSRKIISISKKGIEILGDTYGIPASKCVHIHHGVHQTHPHDMDEIKRKLGIIDKKILLTFGLLSRNKSLEVVIQALHEVVERHPDVVYIILGATHPHVLTDEGEAYRDSLVDLTHRLHLDRNVLFIDRFVSNEELFDFLHLCDIYVIPYLGQKQISSGTLIYAMGAGKPIISTPFWYAEEMLAEGRGALFDFNDSEQLSGRIIHLLDNEAESATMARNAFALAEQCYWPNIGKQYIELLYTLVAEDAPASWTADANVWPALSLPSLNLYHLRMLTDYTGILQHARYTIPNRSHGYCIDDNARALMLCIMLQNHVQDREELYRLTSIYLSFIDYSYNSANGKFRNFLSYERNWLEEEGSEDSIGRTIWALGYATAYTEVDHFYHHADHLFRQGLSCVDCISHPRALAYLILGLASHVRIFHEASVARMLENKAAQLSAFFDRTIDQEWIWFDNIVTYGNCRIPHALIAAGIGLEKKEWADRGIKILDWLIQSQFVDDIFTPIGNKGWMTPEKKALFDQQPIEAHGMIGACLMAEEYRKDGRYVGYARKAFDWFSGENVCSSLLYDSDTGGCRDGLHAEGVNLNQGAESTLSWLMSLLSISRALENKNK